MFPSSIATPRYDVPSPVTPEQPAEPIPAGGFEVVRVSVDALRYVMTPSAEIFARSTERWTFVPAGIECIAVMSEHRESTFAPFTPTISSATCIPALWAGDGATTELMIAPVGVEGVFHPTASKAATSAASFESLISR